MSVYDLFKDISVTSVSDVLKGLSNMEPAIKPLQETYKINGPACTVKILANDNRIFLQGLHHAKPGDVLVVDVRGYEYTAVVGDFMVGAAKTLGLAGLVIDGAIRDIVQVKAMKFPVFCRGGTAAASGKGGIGEVNVPVVCGGVVVRPADLILGDADGVVVVPKESMEEVMKKAVAKEKKDQERAKLLTDVTALRLHLENMFKK